MQTVICSRFVAVIFLWFSSRFIAVFPSSNQFSLVLPVYQFSWVLQVYQFSWVPQLTSASWFPRQVEVPHTFQFPSYNQFSWVSTVFVFPNLPVLLRFPRQVDMQTIICYRFVAMILSSNQFSWVLPVYQHSWVHPIYQFSCVPTAYHFSWVPSTSYSFTHISIICRPASVLVL